MAKTSTSGPMESRWLAGAVVVAVVTLLAILPGRVTLFPAWVPYALGMAMIVPMVGAVLNKNKGRWETIERISAMIFFVVVVVGAIVLLFDLVQAMVMGTEKDELTGLELLASSVGVWVTNVLAFSLLYWQVDRGGPGARENHVKVEPDWQFTQSGCPADVPAGWQPAFVDYLYLGYSTATAFSSTDALPLTSRAKLLMMLESTISLVTIVVVASRAINVLGN